MAKEYFLSQGDEQLAPSFMLHEFQSNHNGNDRTDRIVINPDLIALLQAVHDHFGGSTTVTRGFSTPEVSVACGGYANDQHVQANAADIMQNDSNGNLVDSSLVCCFVQDHGATGIGYMGNATHVDLGYHLGDGIWFGDETKGINIPNRDFYAYFNVAREVQEAPAVDLGDGSREEVIACYARYLSRMSREDEIVYWADKIKGGESVSDVASEIANSDEANNDSLTRSLYKVLLFRTDREISDDEIAGWRGYSTVDKVRGFLASEEYLSKL